MRKVTNMQYTFTGYEAPWYIFIGMHFAKFVFPHHWHFNFKVRLPGPTERWWAGEGLREKR